MQIQKSKLQVSLRQTRDIFSGAIQKTSTHFFLKRFYGVHTLFGPHIITMCSHSQTTSLISALSGTMLLVPTSTKGRHFMQLKLHTNRCVNRQRFVSFTCRVLGFTSVVSRMSKTSQLLPELFLDMLSDRLCTTAEY